MFQFNERIQYNEQPVSDAVLCHALAQVESARGAITLTYFEFTTLAALWLFQQQNAEVVVLEVGLGGRLDAVNIVDATHAVVTTIGLDHVRILGDTRAKIAAEKAGIFRAHQRVFLGPKAADVPLLPEAARQQGAHSVCCPPAETGPCAIPRESAGLARAVCTDLARLYPVLTPAHLNSVLAEVTITLKVRNGWLTNLGLILCRVKPSRCGAALVIKTKGR